MNILTIFSGRPWLAFVVAGVLIVLGSILSRKDELNRGILVNLTGMMWFFYGLYESMVRTIFDLPPGLEYFRFDMLILFPVLGVTTLASLFFVWSGLR